MLFKTVRESLSETLSTKISPKSIIIKVKDSRSRRLNEVRTSNFISNIRASISVWSYAATTATTTTTSTTTTSSRYFQHHHTSSTIIISCSNITTTTARFQLHATTKLQQHHAIPFRYLYNSINNPQRYVNEYES